MRELPWDGYVNARDLGGLPTSLSTTGYTISGRIARGPRRERLTAAGWADANAWGLSSIIDLRCAHEIGRRDGDPETTTVSMAPSIVHAPTEDHTNPEFRATCFPILDSPEYWQHNWRILPDLVRATFHQIAHAGPGILVHCSAGRDRTGMISALLLANAGVAPDVVADDYAQSVRAMAGTATLAPTHDRQASWTPSQTEYWIAETSPIVEIAAREVDVVFDQVGLPLEDRARLRALLTEP
jgi:protein-tyrosine phosphatase